MTPPLAAASERLRGQPGRPRKAPAPAMPPAAVNARLLDVPTAAAYLSVSPWTIRDLISAGTLKRVVIPGPGGRDLRRQLLDRDDLDRLVTAWKA